MAQLKNNNRGEFRSIWSRQKHITQRHDYTDSNKKKNMMQQFACSGLAFSKLSERHTKPNIFFLYSYVHIHQKNSRI